MVPALTYQYGLKQIHKLDTSIATCTKSKAIDRICFDIFLSFISKLFYVKKSLDQLLIGIATIKEN